MGAVSEPRVGPMRDDFAYARLSPRPAIATQQPVSSSRDAYDPQLFREGAETALALLDEHLRDSSTRGLDLTDPRTLLGQATAIMGSDDQRRFEHSKLAAIIDLYIRTGIQVHSPGYMGRQFSGVVPLAGVIDFVSSVLNQPSSFYEAAQLPNVAERIMADELNRFIGWEPDTFAMVTTSGGSLANLTALLAARNHAYREFWTGGVCAVEGRPRPGVAVGEDVHYSVVRAVGIMGIGESQVVRLPLNDRKQLCAEQVIPTLDAARRRGIDVFCMVATAGTTALGAFDPLDELGDIAREQGIWLHVDGAHGASLLVSDKQRYKLKGIEKADSIAWDAHKMMFVPAPCTLLFYRNKEKSRGAFRQMASYVFEERPDIYTALDSAESNFECTKRPMIMTLWALWALFGKELFATKIDYLCDMAQEAHGILRGEPDFQTLHRPESNILCFRYCPAELAPGDVHQFQTAVRNVVKRRGRFFISKVDVDGVSALRVVFMNHDITAEHFRALLDEIRDVGQTVLRERS